MPIKSVLRVLGHVAIGVLLYGLFSFSLFLGLQVRPLLGNIGILVTVALTAAYIYWIIRRYKRKHSGRYL